MLRFVPTNEENLFQRLWLRYLICYCCAVTIEILLLFQGLGLVWSSSMKCLIWSMVPLALIAAFLTVGNAYLLLLTLLKGVSDTALLYRFTQLVQTDTIRILHWNICFCLIAASLLVYLFAAVKACRFAFYNTKRDFHLVFSKPFALFCLEALFFAALTWLIFICFSQLQAHVPAFDLA